MNKNSILGKILLQVLLIVVEIVIGFVIPSGMLISVCLITATIGLFIYYEIAKISSHVASEKKDKED